MRHSPIGRLMPFFTPLFCLEPPYIQREVFVFTFPGTQKNLPNKISNLVIRYQRGVVCLLMLVCMPFVLQGQELCKDMGDGGFLYGELSNETWFEAAAVQEDGKLVMVGKHNDELEGAELFVQRLLPDGRWDETFGDRGNAVFQLTNGFDGGRCVATDVGPKDMIVVGGGGAFQAYVAAIHTGGGLVHDFANRGERFFASTGPVWDILLDENRIYAIYPGGSGFKISALDLNGELIDAFGTNGTLFIPDELAISSTQKLHLERTPQGQLMVLALAESDINPGIINKLLLYRLSPDGNLDQQFGINGRIEEPVLDNISYQDFLVDEDGHLFMGGHQKELGYSIVQKYLPDGSRDLSFNPGGGGQNISPSPVLLKSMVLTDGGDLLFAGSHQEGDQSRFLISAFEKNGDWDAGMGANTWTVSESIVEEGELTDLIRIDDASYLAVGGIRLSDYSTRGIAVKLNEDGSIQSDWGEAGYHWGHGLRQAQASVIKQLDDGSFIAAGYQNINGNLGQDIPALAKFQPDGSLDRTFAFRGHLTRKLDTKYNRPVDLEVLADGKIMVMGRHDLNEGWLLGRLYADGRMDSTFDKDGWRMEEIDCSGCRSYPKNWRIDHAGNILMVVAFFEAGESREDPALVRLTPEGQLDASFGEQGVVLIEETFLHHGFNDVEILSDGGILAAGFLQEGGGLSSPQQSAFMAKFTASGALDESFGDQGIMRWETQDWYSNILQVRQLPSGNILLAGEVQEEDDRDQRRVALWQLSSDGMLDPDFGKNGKQEVDFPDSRKHEFYSFEINGEGNILVFGSGIASGHTTFITRLDATGQQDADFGDNGLYIPEDFAMYPRGVPPLLLSDNRLVLPVLKPATLNFSFACIDLLPGVIDTTTQQPSDTTTIQEPKTFSVLPNPATDEVNVLVPESLSQQTNTLRLTDLTGKIWLNMELDASDQIKIDISPLPKGLYIMMLQSNQDIYLQRFVKI